MATFYYRYGDERLYTHPISVGAKEVKMEVFMLDCGVPKDYARKLCEDLSHDEVKCTEFSAYYLSEYGGPSGRDDDSILRFCGGWVKKKGASVTGVKRIVCHRTDEGNGDLCVQRFLPSISAFREYPYRQKYVPLENCDQYAGENKVEGRELERNARVIYDTLYKLSFTPKEGRSMDRFYRDKRRDREEPSIACFWMYESTALEKGEYYKKDSQDQKDMKEVRKYLTNHPRVRKLLVDHHGCYMVGKGYTTRIYLEEQWECLEYVGNALRVLTSSRVSGDDIEYLEGKFDRAKGEMKYELAGEQEEAIRACCRNRLSIISGLGGSGKSTIIRTLVKMFDRGGTAVMAFTNKAVKVLRKNLEDHPNLNTIHMSMIISKVRGGSSGYLKGHMSILKFFNRDYSSYRSYLKGKKDYIIDEAGQMGCGLFRKLLSAIIEANGGDVNYLKKCRIIMLGDHYQCGPIEWGYLFNFLVEQKELEGKIFSRSILTMDHRTKGKDLGFRKVASELRSKDADVSSIHTRLAKYKNGSTIYIKVEEGKAEAKVTEMLTRYRPDKLLFSSRKTLHTYNLIARDFYNHRSRVKRDYRDDEGKYRTCDYAIGDRVKMVKNAYAMGLYNGDEGVVVKVDEKGITCEFDDTKHLFLYGEKEGEKEGEKKPKLYCRYIYYSYCETIYSSQGSEYGTVLIVADNRIDRDQLYTALTRAKERCIVVDVISDRWGSSTIEYFLPRARNDKTLDLPFL